MLTDANKKTLSITPELINKLEHQCFKHFIVKCFRTLNPTVKFSDNWHIDLIVNHLKTTLYGSSKRLIINIPPRTLKSMIISVAWPAWVLGHDPSKRIIVASYSQSLSLKHSQDCRLIMQNKWYRDLFPKTSIRQGSNEKNKFITTQNGFRFATSVGGTLTGEGGDILIVDDPHTPLQAESDVERTRAIEWFDKTLSTRLNNKKTGAIIVVMQRLHNNDLSGYLIKKKNWQHVNIPAIANVDTVYNVGAYQYHRRAGDLLHIERESANEMATAKLELGSSGFNAQYLQQPINSVGGIIKYSWLKRYEEPDEPSQFFEAIFQSWDCAVKIKSINDYSVCTTWGIKDNEYYLIDVLRQKLEFPELKSAFFATVANYNPNAILVEDKSSGQALIQEIKKASTLPVISIIPSKDKAIRLISISSLFEAGKILLPYSAPWLAIYEHEIINFPNVDHDDMVDSTTQFLQWARAKNLNNIKVRIM